MFPGANRNEIDSLNTIDLKEYRLRVDNVDMVNRDIEKNGNLYQDRINMTLINAGKSLKDINETINPPNKYKFNDGSATANSGITTIMTPTPLTNTEKLLQVNMTTTQDVGLI